MAKSSSPDLAWVSGAVLGPLFLIALVAAIFFALRYWRKNKRKLADNQQPPQQLQTHQAQQPLTYANMPQYILQSVAWEMDSRGLQTTGSEPRYGGELSASPINR